IIVEICFTNNNTGVTGNTVTVATSGLSSGICAYFRADNSSTVCTSATATAITTSRPNARFFVTRVPLTNASNMQFSNITNTSLTLSITKGSGGARIIVCRPTIAAAVVPVNLTNYSANSIYSQGNTTGANNFVVYNGTGNTVNITGLTKNTAYTFTVYEYNGAAGNTAYQTSGYSGSPVTTLPVKWQSFEANRNAKSVTLNWSTASEVNNDYFTVERSLNNQNWFEQINIKGSGNSMVVNKYNYIDNLDATALNFDLYYRIKQVDFDGKFSLSKTVIVKTNSNANTNKTIPNPSNGKFIYISQEPILIPGNLTIINSIGGEVGKLTINNMETPIDMSNLPKGVYYLLFNNNGKSFKSTIVIQ
ncbi:MAG: T9SS type A sorting domain-containing protein, partial [Bacteroidia bacterium]